MTSHSIEDYRNRNEDAPLHLVREAWKPVVRLIDGWAKEKIGMRSGYSSQELDDFSRTHGVSFPPTLREWWRLAGRHPFVEVGLLPGNSILLAPYDRWLVECRDFLIIAVDDVQTWSGNGIHVDFLSEADPEVHGINGITDADESPDLPWYLGKYIATGLRVPTLIYTTLLYHLFQPSLLVRDDAVYLKDEGDPLLSGKRKPDERLVSNLELKHFPNDTMVGDIYSDGLDIVYFWLQGWACRTEEAADRVRRLAPTQPRRF
jgi:hypothetical protein